MTLQSFADRLLATAESHPEIPAENRKRFCKELRAAFPESILCKPSLRKDAARVLHIFLLCIPGEPDEAWDAYASLRDIHDCRICANAIGQVLVKGIMEPRSRKEFGAGCLLSEEEAEKSLEKITAFFEIS